MSAPVAQYLSFSDVGDWLKPRLTAAGLTPLMLPGPAANANERRRSPGSILFLDIGGGAGLSKEYLFDRTFITVLAIGPQNDFDGAQRLALMTDRLLLSLDSSQMLGSTYTLYVTRTGGAPALRDRDAADRYSFTCSYIAEAATGL